MERKARLSLFNKNKHVSTFLWVPKHQVSQLFSILGRMRSCDQERKRETREEEKEKRKD